MALAGSNLLLTILYAGIAVWMLGLAVPVTASYIIAAVMVVPALVQVGVAELAAHMFVFYYAVLSEVSPPTALSPFAAAAITGGSPFRTTMLSWKYTAPAFVVPFAFTIDPQRTWPAAALDARQRCVGHRHRRSRRSWHWLWRRAAGCERPSRHWNAPWRHSRHFFFSFRAWPQL